MPNQFQDEHGKFKKGIPGGPGRGTKKFEERYELAYRRAVSEEDVYNIMVAAVEQALKGDRYARDFVYDHIFGPVSNIVNQGGSIQLIMDGFGIKLGGKTEELIEANTEEVVEGKVEEICPDQPLDLPPESKP